MKEERFFLASKSERAALRNIARSMPRYILWRFRVRVLHKGHKCDYSEGYCSLKGIHQEFT